MSVEELPFVQVQTSVTVSTQRDGSVTTPVNLRFLSADPDAPPTSADYGVTEATKAAKLNRALGQLAAVNNQVLVWLTADAANAIQFAKEPFVALQQAVPDVDFSTLKELGPDIFQ
ncbi:MAG: hypothetical protein AAFZ52_01185 [Bacteroidota bacterium]